MDSSMMSMIPDESRTNIVIQTLKPKERNNHFPQRSPTKIIRLKDLQAAANLLNKENIASS